MLKYYLDKTGKVIKSILFPSSEFVDTEPREGSLNPLASGAVANVMPQDASKDNPLMTAEDTERMIDAMKPIDAMTLRFEFSKKDYNPNTAGVGSAGTWTKVDSPTLNIWDWKNTNTAWENDFKGAFVDPDNEVRIIAAGDTSTVTSFKGLFAGDMTKTPVETGYVLNARSSVIECVPFDISGASSLLNMFGGSSLKHIVKFKYPVGPIAINSTFADTLIEDIDEFDFCGATSTSGFGAFVKNSKLKHVGKVLGLDNIANLNSLFGECGELETIDYICSLSVATNIQATFYKCYKLKAIPKLIAPNVENISAICASCWALESADFEFGSAITVASLAFNACRSMKTYPNIDVSSVADLHSTFNNSFVVETIQDWDVDSVTNCKTMFSNCYKAKYGILEMYNKLLARGAAITDHTNCFLNCGRDTSQGRAALAQIPQSWGGLAEG